MSDCHSTLLCFQTTSAFSVAHDFAIRQNGGYSDVSSCRPFRSESLRKRQYFVYFHPSIRLLSAIKRANWLSASSEIRRRLQNYGVVSPGLTCCLHRQDGNDASADLDSPVQNDVSEGLDLGTNAYKRRRKEQLEEELFLASQRLRLRQDREILRIRAHRPIWTYLVSSSALFLTVHTAISIGKEVEEDKRKKNMKSLRLLTYGLSSRHRSSSSTCRWSYFKKHICSCYGRNGRVL